MKCNSDKSLCFLVLSLISFDLARPEDIDFDGLEEKDYDKGCGYLNCERGDVCVQRRFPCKNSPCPSMLFCARTRKEFMRGPATCDFARCTRGYMCVVKVRRCHWDEKCAEQVGRCVSKKEYNDDPASCAGYSCPVEDHCILKESNCAEPPCKLSRSCERSTDVQAWHSKCRNLGCPSEYECFLRKAEENCSSAPCEYIPDCTTTIEDELRSEYCKGWICPRYRTCIAEVVGSCETKKCDIMRSCQRLETQAGKTFAPHNEITVKTTLHQPSGKMETTYTTQEEFQEWLESVKAALGPDTYKLWLDYIDHSANSEWIPIPRSILSVGPRRSFKIGQNGLSVTEGKQNSDRVPSVTTLSNFKTQVENNNSIPNNFQCQCNNLKLQYFNFWNESENNRKSDQSLDNLNVNELLDIIDELIKILNSSSVGHAMKETMTQDDSPFLNAQSFELQEKILYPVVSPNLLTGVLESSEVPGEQSLEKVGLNYSTPKSGEFHTKIQEQLRSRQSSSSLNKFEDNTERTANDEVEEDEVLLEETKEPLPNEKEENEAYSSIKKTAAPGQSSFGSQEQISRTAHPIYTDHQTGSRTAHSLPSYGAQYNGNSSYDDYEFYNPTRDNINITNANLNT